MWIVSSFCLEYIMKTVLIVALTFDMTVIVMLKAFISHIARLAPPPTNDYLGLNNDNSGATDAADVHHPEAKTLGLLSTWLCVY